MSGKVKLEAWVAKTLTYRKNHLDVRSTESPVDIEEVRFHMHPSVCHSNLFPSLVPIVSQVNGNMGVWAPLHSAPDSRTDFGLMSNPSMIGDVIAMVAPRR